MGSRKFPRSYKVNRLVLSVCNITGRMKWYDAKGDAAARLRQRKYALLRRFPIPPNPDFSPAVNKIV